MRKATVPYFPKLSLRQQLALNGLVALSYYALAELSRSLASTPNDVTPVWPPDGIAVATTLVYGPQALPGVYLGSWLANIWAFWNPDSLGSLTRSIVAVLGIALGTTLGTWLGSHLLNWATGRGKPLQNVSDTIRFLAYLGLVAPLVNATFGAAMLAFNQTIPWLDYGPVWLTWWISNVAGILILSPVLLSGGRVDRPSLVIFQIPTILTNVRHHLYQFPQKRYEAIALCGLLLLLAWMSFWGNQSLAYMLMPLLLWAAFRFGQLGATLAVLITASIAILGTVRGRGTFAEAHLNGSLLSLQSFIVVIVFTVLLLLAVLEERRTTAQQLQNAVAQLQASNQTLGDRSRQLDRANRLKDEFLGMVSHELRTPLIGILGMSEILSEGMLGSLSPQQGDAIEKIASSGQHLLYLINDLLDLTSIESGHITICKTPVTAQAVYQSSLDIVIPMALQKQIHLTGDCADGLGYLDADAKRLQQIFTNLLCNAIKFTPSGGQVQFTVQEHPEQSSLLFTVTDTGIGLAQENIDRICERFFQVKPKGNETPNNPSQNSQPHDSQPQEGLGLGLAISRQLIDLHQGKLTVTSQIGQGSCFCVELPKIQVPASLPNIYHPQESSAAQSHAAQDASLSPLSQAPVKLGASQSIPTLSSETDLAHRPCILIAEDDAVSRAVLTSYLKRHHYRIAIAKNGVEAIEQFHQTAPSIVLMDIQMPVMGGLEAMRKIRQQAGRDIPIIAMTAMSLDRDREKCLEAGATSYMSKPVQLKSLLFLIQAQILTQEAT